MNMVTVLGMGDILKHSIYFDKESPDYNFGLWGNDDRLSANRFIICLMTEFGLNNDKRMQIQDVNSSIMGFQATVIIRE